jgi:hypothetical protein
VRLTFALLLLGRLVTSASAHGTCVHEMADPFSDAHASAQEQLLPTRRFGETFARQRYFGREAAGFGRW